MNSFYKLAKSGGVGVGGMVETNSDLFTPLQTFISFIIIGYFGIKIVYSTFLGYYPDKFYDRNIEITKEEKTGSESASISVYNPGSWNNEFTDFITLLILSLMIYLFSNFHQKEIIQKSGVISMAFLVGYIIGLGYPILIKAYSSGDDQKFGTYVSGVLLSICAIAAIYSNYASDEPSFEISIYFVALFLLLYGLYLTRKKSDTLLNTKVYKTENQKCTSSSTGIIQSSGEKLHFSTAFMTLIVLLLFKRDPADPSFRLAIYFIFGILLGIFVSSVSYFGIEYFLQKTPGKVCDDIRECELKSMEHQNKTAYEFVRDYLRNIIEKKSGSGKSSILEETSDILEEDYINDLNTSTKSYVQIQKGLFERVFGAKSFGFIEKYSFIDKVKMTIFGLIFILLAYLLFIAVYNSFN